MKGEGYADTDIRNDEVNVFVTDDVDISKIRPIIEVTSGATITPASEEIQDFSQGPVKYTVVSEDQNYSKEYTVRMIRLSSVNLKFDFENWEKTSQGFYKMMVKTEEGYSVPLWDSGNPGIAFVVPDDNYPTAPTTDSYTGKYAAKLETSYGGVKIGNINIPIFSGSLFYGNFYLLDGIGEPRKCLRLGRLHPQKFGKPLTFTGYYKYKMGSPYVYLNENKEEIRTDDIKDGFSIYAVLFKITKGQSAKEYLDGITIANSDKIVARADWKEETAAQTDQFMGTDGKGFTRFTIPFVYKAGEEILDYSKYDYKLTIMFASSKDGNEYKGSLGSTLIVDDVEVICDKD